VYTDINGLCEKTLEALAFQVDLSQILIDRRFEETLPKTVADPHQLQQAFFNIVLNAYQAIQGERGKGKLMVETRRSEGMILIAFHDDGPGIPQEHLGKIFDPFFTTKDKGTGLGLSVAYGIVEAHEGKLMVRSSPEGGATFLIELPLLRGTFQADASWPEDPRPLARKRVLVIDSDANNLTLLLEVIRHLGHEVEGVYSVPELLERVSRQPYDVLIAPAGLPHMDGRALYQQVSVLRPELARSTVFIVDDALSDDVYRFLEQVGCQLLRKPFNIADIEMTMRNALES
jgi:two-component system NtrC family sensor kinase